MEVVSHGGLLRKKGEKRLNKHLGAYSLVGQSEGHFNKHGLMAIS